MGDMHRLRPDVSVVICAYTDDRWADLLEAVSSVQSQTLQPREILVVIDHNAGLLERARAELAGVAVVENRARRGLSGARNSGILASRGSIVAFLDDDARAAPDWLEWLTRHYSDHLVLGVGGTIEPCWERGRPRWFPPELDWVVGCTYEGLPTDTAPVRNLIGASMSFRRDVFETVGGFRDGLGRVGSRPLGCEETELCIRARQRWPDGRFIYEPRAWVYHRVPLHRSTWGYFRSRCYAEGLSKALVSRTVGSKDGLASEAYYTVRTLPAGCLRGLADTVRYGDATGLARAGAIVAGLGFTTAGYLNGILRRHAVDLRAGTEDQASVRLQPGASAVAAVPPGCDRRPISSRPSARADDVDRLEALHR
jgi:glycosyltransferase involved in cell wall biosynthesis